MQDSTLIAEFMGYRVFNKGTKCYSPKYNDGTIAPMQFHTSWDWLMPVVAKIQNGIDSTFCPSADIVLTYGMAVAKIRREIARQQKRSK